MIHLKFGTSSILLGADEYLIKCPSCETDQWADVMLISVYYYFLFIPVFPTHKEANIICQKCGLKINGVPFNGKIFHDPNEVKNKYRHPWFTYTGIAFALLIVIIVFIAASA